MMILRSFLCFACCLLFGGQSKAQTIKSERWIYKIEKPAERWEDALVTGNGSIGTMVMGNPRQERIVQVHEKVMIPNVDPRKYKPSNLVEILPRVRELIKQNRSDEAGMLIDSFSMEDRKKQGFDSKTFFTGPVPHPAFEILINYPAKETRNYIRYVDAEHGEVGTAWQDDQGEITERVFSSRADDVNITQIRKKGGKLNIVLQVREVPGQNKKSSKTALSSKYEVGTDEFYVHTTYSVDQSGFESLTTVKAINGTQRLENGAVVIEGADEVLIKTKINYLDVAAKTNRPDIRKYLDELPDDYQALFAKHASIHAAMFNTVQLILTDPSESARTNDDVLTEAAANGATPVFIERAHAMGRYHLMAAAGEYFSPLQGIWGASWNPAWSGGFVFDSNVNLQIAGAPMGNMNGVMESYMQFLERQLPGFRLNAKKTYGVDQGFIIGHYSDQRNGYSIRYNQTHAWPFWSGGFGWNLRPFYDYYLTNRNEEFLRTRVYPLYKELANMYVAILQKDKNGETMIIPSFSPENTPAGHFKGKSKLTYNSTIDIAVFKEVFRIAGETARKFNMDDKEVEQWQKASNSLPAYRINEDGALAEWVSPELKDRYDHRHISHLYPVYPGDEVLSEDLKVAANKALDFREEHNTTSAHGLLHLGLMSARLGNRDRVKVAFDRTAKGGYYYQSFATSHNRNHAIYNFDLAHGMIALIYQSMVYSDENSIEFFKTWPENLQQNGEITGLATFAGVDVDLKWNKEKLVKATLHPLSDTKITVAYGAKKQTLNLKKGRTVVLTY